MHRSFATPRGQQKSHYPCVDDDVEFQERMAEHIQYMVETLLTTRLILIQRYKTDEYSTATLAGKLAERVGMDSVDPQD